MTAKLNVISTTEPVRIGYDASNYLSVTVGSTGDVGLTSIGKTTITAGTDILLTAAAAKSIELNPGTDGIKFGVGHDERGLPAADLHHPRA